MKDAIGNRLAEGHLVQLRLPGGQTLNGHVAEISEGGLVAVGGTRKHDEEALTPGICKVRIEIEALADPRSGTCPAVMRLVDPAEQHKTQ